MKYIRSLGEIRGKCGGTIVASQHLYCVLHCFIQEAFICAAAERKLTIGRYERNGVVARISRRWVDDARAP
jgi:hypothetical protein